MAYRWTKLTPLLKSIIKKLRKDYEGRGVIIREVAHGYRVETIPEVSESIKRVVKPKKTSD
jgi:segregation and condensation protein B